MYGYLSNTVCIILNTEKVLSFHLIASWYSILGLYYNAFNLNSLTDRHYGTFQSFALCILIYIILTYAV